MDLPEREPHVVAEEAHAFGVVHKLAVRRRDRAEAIWRWPRRTLVFARLRQRRWRRSDAHAGAAVPVVEKHSERAVRRTRFRDEQVLAVRRPGRRAHVLRSIVRRPILAYRTRIRPVRVREPQILDAAAIAQKGDRLAIGRELRLAVERHASENPFRCTAFDRQRVDVAEKIEGDRLAVGRHVERHPRPLVGCELDRLSLFEDQSGGRSSLVFLIRSVLRAHNQGRRNHNRDATSHTHGKHLHAPSWVGVDSGPVAMRSELTPTPLAAYRRAADYSGSEA